MEFRILNTIIEYEKIVSTQARIHNGDIVFQNASFRFSCFFWQFISSMANDHDTLCRVQCN